MTQSVGILCGGKIFKKVLLGTLILIFSASFFFSQAQDVFAQGGPYNGPGPTFVPPNFSGGPDDRGTLPNVTTNPTASPVPASDGTDRPVSGGSSVTSEAAAASAQAVADQTSENIGALDDPVLQFLHKYILTGIGSFVGFTGLAFDYAIEGYIIGFGDLYINKNVGVAIDSLWGTVRDIFNLTFIFGLVYIGFKMILDSSDSSARKMLISLIGAALLVNFSLFITKFVVDFSNIAATEIYKAFGDTEYKDFSITNGFMTMMGINDLIGVEMTASAGYAYIVGMLIVFAVLIYVFLAGAIMIIIRFVVLCIYMVFSPMMFLGWVFPAMKGHSEKYWSGFLKQAFFAPAFIFMLYLSYRVTFTFNYTTKNWGHFFGQGVAEPVGVDGLIPFFAMVIIFLLASIMVAKNMGAVGAATAISVGNKIRGSAQGVMYRNTGGRLAKGALNVMDRSGISNLPGTRSLRSAVKSGYEYGAGGTSLAKTRSDIKSEKAEITENQSRMFKDGKSKKRKKIIADGTAEGATQEQIDAMQREAAGVSSSDLEYMTQAQRLAIAPYVTDSAIEDFGKSEKVGAASIGEFKKTRAEYIKNSIRHGNELLTSEFSKLSIAQLESVGEEFILANAEHLTTDQMKAIKGSKKFATGQMKNIENTRRARFSSGSGFTQTYTHYDANNTATVKSRHRDPKEIASMPTSALVSTESAKYMNSRVLKEIEKNNNLELTERETIMNNILQDPTGNVDGRKYLATSKVINDGYWG